MGRLKELVKARLASISAADALSLSAEELPLAVADVLPIKEEKTAAVNQIELVLSAISKKYLSLGEFLRICNEGGAFLQTGEIFPPNFEFLGREKAQELFKQFGAIYDRQNKCAIFFLGEYQYCELSRAQMFDSLNAEYVKNFVLALQNWKK